MSKIIAFSDLLTTLSKKSVHGYTDIHKLQLHGCNTNINLANLSAGILFDSKDPYNQPVQLAKLVDNNISVQKYYGNNESSQDETFDAQIIVKVRDEETDPYMEVEVIGRCKYTYIIKNGICTLTENSVSAYDVRWELKRT